MGWSYLSATLRLSLIHRGVAAAKGRKRAPESQCQVLKDAASTLLLLSLSLTLYQALSPLLGCFATRQYSGQGQLSDRLTGQIVGPIASPSGDASPPLYFSLPSCPLGRVQSPHPGNMGPGGCSRQLFGNDTMREFIGKAVSACGWGGNDAAHVVLATHTARCAGVNHARSQSYAPLILLGITIFFPMISDSTKISFLFVPFCYCSFGVHMRVSGSTYRRTHFMGTEAFLIARTQQKIWHVTHVTQHVIAAVVDGNTRVREEIV